MTLDPEEAKHQVAHRLRREGGRETGLCLLGLGVRREGANLREVMNLGLHANFTVSNRAFKQTTSKARAVDLPLVTLSIAGFCLPKAWIRIRTS